MGPAGMVLKAEIGDVVYDVRRPENQAILSASQSPEEQRDANRTHKRKSTVSASVDLWFIKIDEYPWMP